MIYSRPVCLVFIVNPWAVLWVGAMHDAARGWKLDRFSRIMSKGDVKLVAFDDLY